MRRSAIAGAVLAVLATVGVVHLAHAATSPTSVTLAASFDSEIGCSGDWNTTCAQAQLTARADGMWSRTVTIPAGTYAYKAALDGSWTESYGLHAGSADIPLTVPAGGKAVTFVYDPATHWVTDDVTSKLVTAAGDFQSELGCAADWAPDCLRPWLEDVDGDGTYTATLTVPAGSWQVKAAVGLSWAENYGQGGVAGGANIVFSGGASVTFSYVASSHVLTVLSGGPAATGTTLGAIYTPTGTTFRIWSPDNASVTVTVSGISYGLSKVTLAGYSDVYQVVVPGDLKDQAYQFAVGGTAVRDPYAQMVKPGTTQGVVVDEAAVLPSTGSWAATPALANREDSVVYELDVRDYTIDASSNVDTAKRGKYLGLVQTGTTNNGVKTGIDHLKELGVTHVQIMPTYDFSSTVPNWGYDPVNYNVPEEQFSQYTSPEDRIREFKDMVNEFHRNGIRVILDVVYNHTVSKDVLQGITSKYYTSQDFSGTGDSLDDSQPMVSRMIRDSLEHWVRDYNVDGFRFDLMGVFHHTDVESWGTYLNATFPTRGLLMYGEPWTGSGTQSPESDYVRYGTVASMQDGHVGVFNGAYRDAIRGGTKDTVLAYMGGAGSASSIATGMRGSPLATKSTAVLSNLWNPAFTYDPEETINYVSVHDDLNLYDKIKYSGVTGTAAAQMDRFAVGMVLTSEGIPLIAEGDEFLRSKVVGGDYTTAMNSYNAGDAVNAIHWGDATTNATTQAYYKAAIALRKATPALRLSTWDAVNAQMATRVDGAVVISTFSDTVVVFNPGSATYTVTMPTGTWTKVLDTTGAVSTTGNTAGARAVTVFRKSA